MNSVKLCVPLCLCDELTGKDHHKGTKVTKIAQSLFLQRGERRCNVSDNIFRRFNAYRETDRRRGNSGSF